MEVAATTLLLKTGRSAACKKQVPPFCPFLGPEQVQAVIEVITFMHFCAS